MILSGIDSDWESLAVDKWLTGEQVLDGKRAAVRKNVSLLGMRQSDFPYELMVNLAYEDVRSDGLPGSQEEIQLLDNNERLVAEYFTRQYNAKFALTVTSDGVRDQFLYLPSSIEEDVLEQAFSELGLTVDYDFGIRECEDWSIYDYALSESHAKDQSASVPWWKRLFGSK